MSLRPKSKASKQESRRANRPTRTGRHWAVLPLRPGLRPRPNADDCLGRESAEGDHQRTLKEGDTPGGAATSVAVDSEHRAHDAPETLISPASTSAYGIVDCAAMFISRECERDPELHWRDQAANDDTEDV
jgi:hypothetical protein